MHSLSHIDVAERRDLVIVDIRPLSERYAGLGFIPGSLSLPMDPEGPDPDRLRAVVGVRPCVLACLTGRRSEVAAHELAKLGTRIVPANLAEGLLGWRGGGLPVAGLEFTWNGVENRAIASATCRDVAACFVAEAVELSLDAGLELDPLELFDQCCVEADVDPKAPNLPGVLRLLDLAAGRTRSLGNTYDRIAANVDKMLGLLNTDPDPTHQGDTVR